MPRSYSLPLLAVAVLASGPVALAQTRPDGAPGNPPSTVTGRAVDRAQGETPRPDGTPGNPPGTAVGRAVDSALGTNTTGANPSATATGAGAATTGPGPAATTATTGSGPTAGSGAGATATAGAAAGGAAMPRIDAASLRGALSARRLIDANVYGANDREIGEIEDIIILPGGAGAPVAVLSVGGFLGFGERHIAVPFAQLQHNAERNRWTLPGATAESLRALPAFAMDEMRREPGRRDAVGGRSRDTAAGAAATGGTASGSGGAAGGTGSSTGQTTPASPPAR